MRAALLLLCALLAPAIAGCTSPTPEPAPPTPGPPPPPQGGQAAQAPWWEVGDAYSIRIERPGSSAQTYRLVNFWNDTKTEHFWLGVADRQLAMEHALFDTNPFLGRIHHHILTPHERGMHAAMYSFPLEDGKRWEGFFFGSNWTFVVRAARVDTPTGPDQGFRVEGDSTAGDGRRIVFDFSPRLKWFSNLEEFDRDGQPILVAKVEQYERDVKGTYTFLRGVDFYRGPALGGTHDERFQVDDDVSGLAFHVDARASGPLEVQLLDPSGNIRQRATATGGAASLSREVRPVPQGEWVVRYVTTASDIQGQVLAIGLQETSRTLS